MIHEQGLVDQLSALPVERYEGKAFRETGIAADPLASSVSGGRWAPRAEDGIDVPVLYTSLERDGALAEVVSYLMLLTPLPSKPLKVARLGVSTAKTLRLGRADLTELAVDMTRYARKKRVPCGWLRWCWLPFLLAMLVAPVAMTGVPFLSLALVH